MPRWQQVNNNVDCGSSNNEITVNSGGGENNSNFYLYVFFDEFSNSRFLRKLFRT